MWCEKYSDSLRKKKTMKAEKSDLNKTEIMRKILRRDA